MPAVDTKERTKANVTVQPPGMYKVMYINDNVTTFEFVIESLQAVFDHSEATATALANAVNDAGAAVVAVLPYEIAEQKGVEVTILARNAGYPLLVKLEQE